MVDLPSWLVAGVLLPLALAAVLLVRARRSMRLLRRHERTLVPLLMASPLGLVAAHVVARALSDSGTVAAAVGVVAAAVQFRWQSSVLFAQEVKRSRHSLSRPDNEQDAQAVLTATAASSTAQLDGGSPPADQASLNRASALLVLSGYSGGEGHLHELFEILARLGRQDDRPHEARLVTAHLLADAWSLRAQVAGDDSGYAAAVSRLESLAAGSPSALQGDGQLRVAPVVAGHCVWQAKQLSDALTHAKPDDQPELLRRLEELVDRGLAAVEHGMERGSGSVEWHAHLVGQRGLLEGCRDPGQASARLRRNIAALPSRPRRARVMPLIALAEAVIAGFEQDAPDSKDGDLDEAERLLYEVMSLEPRMEAEVRRMLARVARLRHPPFLNS